MRKIILIVTVVWVAAMLASIKYGFLDRFVTGIDDKPVGLDFFSTPCGFTNLVAGNSIFLTETSNYCTFRITTPYFNHPALAVVVGCWTAPFSTQVAYGLFIAVSVLLLTLAGRLLASLFENPTAKAFAYFSLFGSMPTYLMLWAGQMHVFPVVAVAMVLAGLVRIEQDPGSSGRWIQAGILISLFSKPVVLLMLPAFFLLPETRRKMLVPVAIYAVVSLLFLLAPRLNPGGYNSVHWINLFRASLNPSHIFWLLVQRKLDYADSFIIFSLPRLLLGHCSRPVLSLIVAFPLATILAASALPLFLSDRVQQIRVAIVTVSLCVLSHYLCYFIVLEYQYTTILPLIPTILWLRNTEDNQKLRWLLTGALLSVACVMLPTFKFISPDTTAYWLPNALLHVVPVVIAFVLLTVYVAAFACIHTYSFQTLRLQLSARPAVVGGLLVTTVFIAAYATIPNRLLTDPDEWTSADWIDHFEDIVSRPGVKPEIQLWLHRQLAIDYTETNQDLALQHYRKANRLTTRHDALTVEMAGVFLSKNQKKTAARLLATLIPEKITEQKVRKRFDELRHMCN